MTAALELAGLSPELLEAIVAQVTAKLTLVPLPPEPEGLSMLAASVRRRACERRQADAARGDRSGIDREGLSTIPATVRSREWKRRQAAAKKARSIPDRAPPHVLQGEARDQKHAEVRGTSDATGPLAGAVAGILGRAFGATNLRLRKAYQAIRTGVGIGSKGQIQLGEMWAKTSSEKADARLLVEEFTIPQIKAMAVSIGGTWRPNAKSPRVTVGLVRSRLLASRDGSPPVRANPTRPTGEQLEMREQARARAAAPAPAPAPAQKGDVVSPARYSLDRADPPYAGTETRTVPIPGTSETASDVVEVGKNSGEAVSPVSTPEQRPRGKNTALSSAGPLQLAEPSPTSSAEARDVLELVNATAARCRAFKTSPELRSKAAAARNRGPP